MRGEERFD